MDGSDGSTTTTALSAQFGAVRRRAKGCWQYVWNEGPPASANATVPEWRLDRNRSFAGRCRSTRSAGSSLTSASASARRAA